jgi:hypothetical protein
MPPQLARLTLRWLEAPDREVDIITSKDLVKFLRYFLPGGAYLVKRHFAAACGEYLMNCYPSRPRPPDLAIQV